MRGRGRPTTVHVSASEFDTPVSSECLHPPARRNGKEDGEREHSQGVGEGSCEVLEAPGRFVSRDMLARTPLCAPVPAPASPAASQSQDDSLPPPPPSHELMPGNHAPEPRGVSPDMDPPPPPPASEDCVQPQLTESKDRASSRASNLPSGASETQIPDMIASRKLPTGKQLARTPAAAREGEEAPVDDVPSSDLPSGNYNVPEVLQKVAFVQDQSTAENEEALRRYNEQQKKAEEIRKRKNEEVELKRKKREMENLAKEKRKIEEEKKHLEEMRKALQQQQEQMQQQQKKIEWEKTKLKKDEEKLRRLSRQSGVSVRMAPVARPSLCPLPVIRDSPNSVSSVPTNQADECIRAANIESPNIGDDLKVKTDTTNETNGSQDNSLQRTQVKSRKLSKNERKELLRETMKANVEKRKESTENMLKMVRENARIRKEEEEKNLIEGESQNDATKYFPAEEDSPSIPKAPLMVPDQDMSVSSTSADKIEPANEEVDLMIEQEDSLNMTVKTEIITMAPLTKKIVIGRKEGARKRNQSLLTDEGVRGHTSNPRDDLESVSPPKKTKVDKTISVGRKKPSDLVFSKILAVPERDDADKEESPLYAPLPQCRRKKAVILTENVSVEEPEKSRPRRRKNEVVMKDYSDSEDSTPPKKVKGRAGKKKEIQSSSRGKQKTEEKSDNPNLVDDLTAEPQKDTKKSAVRKNTKIKRLSVSITREESRTEKSPLRNAAENNSALMENPNVEPPKVTKKPAVKKSVKANPTSATRDEARTEKSPLLKVVDTAPTEDHDVVKPSKVAKKPAGKKSVKAKPTITTQDKVRTEKSPLSKEAEGYVAPMENPVGASEVPKKKSAGMKSTKTKSSNSIEDVVRTEKSPLTSGKDDNIAFSDEVQAAFNENAGSKKTRKPRGKAASKTLTKTEKDPIAVEVEKETSVPEAGGRPKRSVKKKFDTLEGFADRFVLWSLCILSFYIR